MRGIPYIQIPTTLLSMVDSSVGGKTGVDTKWGKNLIGTFKQPKSVYIDLTFLKTLPKKQIKNGIAEIIKYGVIENTSILKILNKNYKKIINLDNEIIKKLIIKCIKIKTSYVETDEKESGLRKTLNYGHTFGHAIEKTSNFKIQHGEAVSIGISMINTIAKDKKILNEKDHDFIKNIIKLYKLPKKIPKNLNSNKIIDAIKFDKKNVKNKIMFIIPKKIGKVALTDKITKRDILKACKKHS
jgi:3-dehydroquinate synthase